MNIEFKLSGDGDSHIIKNLWPAYQHEVSEFGPLAHNRHGLFGADDSFTTLAEHTDALSPWWREPEALFPYVILVDGYAAGFNLIAARSRLPEGLDADFIVHEFFVLHAYRGKGVAEKAAIDGFNMHRGKWEVVTYPPHGRAIAFWRRVISSYSSNQYSEDNVDHTWGRKVAWTFDNAQGPGSPD
jgi:aminoglycoside 6'-N-acetyltransferase I